MHPNMHLPSAQSVQQFREPRATHENAATSKPKLNGSPSASVEIAEQASTGIQSENEFRSKTGEHPEDVKRQVVIRRVEELHLHPSYVRHHLTVPAPKPSALDEQGNLAFQGSLLITRDGTVLDGYDRWELGRRQGRATVPCIEYELTESEALLWLLQKHRRSNRLNDFCRILLATDLEPSFRERARSNQQAGGQNKGSSNLTEAGRLDVRSEIAAAAGVCVGNVSKVKQLLTTAHWEIRQALHSGEISIHRAWLWSKEPSDKQFMELRRYRDNRATNKIKRLISRHRSKSTALAFDPSGILKRLAALDSNELAAVSVRVVKGSGKVIYLTKDLLQSLPSYQEQMPT
jgi:hypothetical protein